jgi:hypothetical protein
MENYPVAYGLGITAFAARHSNIASQGGAKHPYSCLDRNSGWSRYEAMKSICCTINVISSHLSVIINTKRHGPNS